MTRQANRLRWAAVLVLVASTIHCASGGSSTDLLEGQGMVTVNLHDQAGPGIDQVHVTFSSLELRDADSGSWFPVDMQGMPTLDLLVLVNGNQATLATGPVPEGVYDAMRITIEAVQIVLTDGNTIDLGPPELPASVNVTGFPEVTVEAGGSLTVTLDFPVGASFQINGGNVAFTPTVTFDPGP